MGECPLCGQSTLHPDTRLIKDSCGHLKCRMCLLQEEKGCKICQYQNYVGPEEFQSTDCSLPNEITINLKDLTVELTKNVNNEPNIIIEKNIEYVQQEIQNVNEDRSSENIIVSDNQSTSNKNQSNEMYCNQIQIVDTNQSIATVTELNNHSISNLESSNNLLHTNNLLMRENENSANKTIQNNEINGNQIIRSPHNFNFYKSPEFNMSDYLCFKNPYVQVNNSKSPEFRESDYIILKSPRKVSNDNQSHKSPVQSSSYKSPNILLSDCITFTPEPVTNRVKRVEECQVDTSCLELNGNTELTTLKSCVISDDYNCKENQHDYLETNEKETSNNEKESSNQSDNIVVVLQQNNEEKEVELEKVQESTDEDKENKKQFNNLTNNVSKNEIDVNVHLIEKDDNEVQKTTREDITMKPKNKNNIDEKSKKIKPTKCEKTREIRSSIKKSKTKRKRRSIVVVDEQGLPKRKIKNRDWRHIETIAGDPVTYKCTICQKIFKNSRHKSHHTLCLLNETPFCCNICDRKFKKRSHFEYHTRVHSGERPFQCTICSKNFIQNDKLQRHLRSVHNQISNIECGECGKTFKSKQYLKSHLNVHQPKKSFKCKLCPKTFTIDNNRKRHELTHSSGKPYKCDVCSSSFKYNFLLLRHKKIHENIKPFSCDHCQRLFTSKFEIQRHITVHSAAKPFSCKECDLKFRRKDNLQRHILHHHTEDAVIKPATPVPVVIKSPRQKTEIKDKTFSRPNSVISNKSSSSALSKSSRTRESKNGESEMRNPIRIKQFTEAINKSEKIKLGVTQPLPLEEALNINRRIEKSLYSQGSCDFPGLARNIRASSRIRKNSFDSNSISNDETKFSSKSNDERSKTGYGNRKEVKDTNLCGEQVLESNQHKHWRRRITESLKDLDV